MTEDEMAGWHHRLDGREFEWTPGVGDGQGRPGVLQFMGLQRVRHDWATGLNWTDWSCLALIPSYLHPERVLLQRQGCSLHSCFGLFVHSGFNSPTAPEDVFVDLPFFCLRVILMKRSFKMEKPGGPTHASNPWLKGSLSVFQLSWCFHKYTGISGYDEE